jgi:ABC-type transport system involved in multi-copper enzyme maturation permease subunit
VTQALAVTRYTLIELSRRRLLLLVVGVGGLLMVGVGFAPHVLPGVHPGSDSIIVMLTALSTVVPYAMTLCAFAIGMTVINHDLDSGAVVSIFAKPIARSAYTFGKLLAATSLLVFIAAIFTVGSILVVAANGGSVYGVVFWSCATIAANIVLLMLLVLVLTVYINNVAAAAIVFVFNYLAGDVLALYAMVQHNAITDAVARTLIRIAYWGVPHELSSNLERQIVQLKLDTHELVVRDFDPLANIPGASGTVDVVFWLAYVVAIVLLLFWAVRRKGV